MLAHFIDFIPQSRHTNIYYTGDALTKKYISSTKDSEARNPISMLGLCNQVTLSQTLKVVLMCDLDPFPFFCRNLSTMIATRTVNVIVKTIDARGV